MVTGFESFRAHFQGYEDCYTIIGGTACDILMSEAALPFRASHFLELYKGRWLQVRMAQFRSAPFLPFYRTATSKLPKNDRVVF